MKQLFFLALAFLVSVSGPVRAEEPLFSGPAQEAALKNKAKQTFGGTDFFFARGSQKTNEYLPAGETLQDWKQMLAVYIFPGFPSAEQYVTAMVYKMGEHKIPVQAFKAKKDGEFIVIFPMVAKDVTEINFWRYADRPDDWGVIGWMYAVRYYGEMPSKEDFTKMYTTSMGQFVDMPDIPFIP